MAFVKLSLLLAVVLIAKLQAFMPVQRRSSILQTKSLKSLQAKGDDDDETDSEMRERLKKKARKMMFNEKGVAYAPWIAKQVDEDAIVEDLMKKEKGGKSKPKTSVLDRGEVESSEGMKWRMNDDLVELAWVTNSEEGNKGYIVEKRPSYGGDFQEVASFKEVATLLTKGINGGR